MKELNLFHISIYELVIKSTAHIQKLHITFAMCLKTHDLFQSLNMPLEWFVSCLTKQCKK